MKSLAVTTAFLLAAVLWLVYPGGPIVASTGMPPDAASLVERVLPPGWKLYSTYTEGDEITVCLDLPFADLRAGDGMGIEAAVEIVCGALTELDWRRLEVQAVDPDSGGCRSISDYAPRVGSIGRPLVTSDQQPSAMGADVASGALAGKTVYLSAGHGWEWTGSAWRTQRVPYQGFIEDHNNAEVVDQYLIRYLENAGAQVIPVRERDWSAQRAIVNNDQGVPYYTETGVWTTGVSAGYEGTDRYAISVLAPATATATWSVSVPADGSYAVYAWVRPGPNRVPDAHYRVFHAAGSTDVVLDQRIHPQTWRYLGTFSFRSGTAQIVLDNSSFASGAAVMADAIRLGGGLFD